MVDNNEKSANTTRMDGRETRQPVVYKPTATVQIANPFSLIERKLLNAFMFNAQRANFPDDELCCTVSEAFNYIGLPSSRNQQVLKNAIKTLISTIIEWNVLNADRTHEWGACSFLASGKISRGKVRYRINPEVRQKIHHPKLFAKIQLMVQAQISRRHALVLYEFLIDCICRHRADEMVVKDVSLNTVLALMGLTETRYAEQGSYKTFNRDILRPSLSDINTHTDIAVEVLPIRQGRRVAAFDFHVKRDKAYQVMLELDTAKSPPLADAIVSSRSTGVSVFEELQQLLVKRGITAIRAKKLLASHPEERIRTNIALVDAKLAEGKIKRVGAYLTTAIQENYAGTKVATCQSIKPEGQGGKLSSTAARPTADDNRYQEQWMRFRGEQARIAFESLSVAKQEQWSTRYRADHRQSTVDAALQKSGFDNPLVQADFFERFLAPKLLKAPEELSLAAYAKQSRIGNKVAAKADRSTPKRETRRRQPATGPASSTPQPTLNFVLLDND